MVKESIDQKVKENIETIKKMEKKKKNKVKLDVSEKALNKHVESVKHQDVIVEN